MRVEYDGPAQLWTSDGESAQLRPGVIDVPAVVGRMLVQLGLATDVESVPAPVVEAAPPAQAQEPVRRLRRPKEE